jgi:membrane-bound ClpP family serine protease
LGIKNLKLSYGNHVKRAIDIRKLCSLSFVINETASLAVSEAHHVQVFGAVLQRIETLLKAISSTSASLKERVRNVKSDVEENENLAPYWDAKLAMLCDIGAL